MMATALVLLYEIEQTLEGEVSVRIMGKNGKEDSETRVRNQEGCPVVTASSLIFLGIIYLTPS